MNLHTILNQEQFQRYNNNGPRYTSYPTANEFTDTYTSDTYQNAALLSNQSSKPLSLYFHIPFCDTICFYCACNKIATKDRSKADTYLQYLFKEIELQAALYDKSRIVDQLHFGGGTPTFINLEQMRSLLEHTKKHFQLRDDDRGEYSIEIDPRECSKEMLIGLRQLGFNRLSLGVQDFDYKVQKAINRIQPTQLTYQTILTARENNYHSISVDLIYGLPLQNIDSFSKTLEQIIDMQVDRISLFNYAHLPHIFKPQRRINDNDLPSTEVKLAILNQSIQQLTQAGYLYIGMDHFAKITDPLSEAQKNGQLRRNFQGYSTHAQTDMVAMGVSAISHVANTYSQNTKSLETYYQSLEANSLPIIKGKSLNHDDCIRQSIIEQLMCHYHLDFAVIEQRYNIDFNNYFYHELSNLLIMQEDGLLTIAPQALHINYNGRMLIRSICMTFDSYLSSSADKQEKFSKVI